MRTHQALACALMAAAIVMVVASRARAAEPELPIRFEATDPSCPTETAFRLDVTRRLDGASTVGTSYVARVARAGDEWDGSLTATDDHGRSHARTLRGPSCSDTAHALAFMTALAIGLGGWLEEEPPPVPLVQPPPRPAAIEPTRTRPVPPAPPDHHVRAPWRLDAAVGVIARGALAPSLGLGGELAFDVVAPSEDLVSPRIDVAFDGATSGAEVYPQGTVQLTLVSGRIDVCPLRWSPSRRVSLRPCAGGELGAVSGRGQTSMYTSQGVMAWVALEAGGSVRFQVTERVFVDSSAAALFPLIHTAYRFGPSETVFTVPPATGRFVLSIGVQL